MRTPILTASRTLGSVAKTTVNVVGWISCPNNIKSRPTTKKAIVSDASSVSLRCVSDLRKKMAITTTVQQQISDVNQGIGEKAG
jgi:hypothetical protein